MDLDSFSTWLEIDLGAIRNNVHKLTEICGTSVMGVVKANGYGHGMVEVSRAAVAAGAAWLGVARIEEALVLRQAGIQCRILVMGFTPPARVPEAAVQNITLTVYDPQAASAYSEQAISAGSKITVHLKIDSGMGRLGAFPGEGVELLRWLTAQPGLDVEGIFTHFARADEPKLPTTKWQLQRFTELLDALQEQGLRPRLVHASNSAAALFTPKARFDLVRCGIAMYGLCPSSEAVLPDGFRPALSLKSRLISVKNMPGGHGISYNHRYVTRREERVGVAAIGYADGFRRRVGAFALVHGQRVPVLGSVCMDMCMVKLDQAPQARVGDEIVFIGQQNGQGISVEDLAAEWNTIDYEVVCGMSARLPRIFLE